MDHITLRKHPDNEILYEGRYSALKDCLEDAVNKGITLPYINLRNKNLTNVNIDGAFMPYADFSGSNLSGANLSEATLHNASFKDSSLYNCCMSFSYLHGSNFSGACFGGTFIDGTDLRNCLFSTLSCFDLDFMHSKKMEGCIFIEPDSRRFGMSNAPIVIKGLLNVPVILFDKTVKIGDKIMRRRDMSQFLKIMEAYTYQQTQNDKVA